MTNITKAAQQALEALYAMAEGSTRGFTGSNASWGRIVMPTDSALNKAESAITALRAALQDKAGEVRGPVADGTELFAQPAPVVPDGFALVPVEPTEAMLQAGIDEMPHFTDEPGPVWSAMIAASRQKGGSAG